MSVRLLRPVKHGEPTLNLAKDTKTVCRGGRTSGAVQARLIVKGARVPLTMCSLVLGPASLSDAVAVTDAHPPSHLRSCFPRCVRAVQGMDLWVLAQALVSCVCLPGDGKQLLSHSRIVWLAALLLAAIMLSIRIFMCICCRGLLSACQIVTQFIEYITSVINYLS